MFRTAIHFVFFPVQHGFFNLIVYHMQKLNALYYYEVKIFEEIFSAKESTEILSSNNVSGKKLLVFTEEPSLMTLKEAELQFLMQCF